MDPNRLYSYFIEMDWLFLVAYSLFVAGALAFASDLWPSRSKSDEARQLPTYRSSAAVPAAWPARRRRYNLPPHNPL